MTPLGRDERGGFPDWEKMTVGSSDRGVLLMHKLWDEQVARVQDGIDPVGIVRGAEAERIIPVPGQVVFVDREEGMRLFNTPLEERIAALSEGLQGQ